MYIVDASYFFVEMKPLWFYPVCISLASNCGGLKAQLLRIAQGSALGGRLGIAKSVALCKSSLLYEGQRPVASRVTRLSRVAFLRRRHKNAECINRGVRFPGRCPGLWAATGLTARLNHLPFL